LKLRPIRDKQIGLFSPFGKAVPGIVWKPLFLRSASKVCIDPPMLPTLKAEREREGDTLRWKITAAINGRPIAEEALKNTIAASERFDEIVAQVKARLSPR